LYQLSDGEFRRYGGRGSIYDPQENARVAGLKLTDESNQVAAKLGRPLTPAEQYLVHQQGVGGAYQHLMHPDQPAWQSMYNTAEGQQKGIGWARRAIWGNVPDDIKAKFGSVDNITSGQFTNLWANKLASRMPPTPAPPLPPAQDVPPPPQIASATPQAPKLTATSSDSDIDKADAAWYAKPGPSQIAQAPIAPQPPIFPQQQPQQPATLSTMLGMQPGGVGNGIRTALGLPAQPTPAPGPGSSGLGALANLFSQIPAQQATPAPQAQPFYAPAPPKIDFTQLALALQGRGSMF
jgi:hypothetical protein